MPKEAFMSRALFRIRTGLSRPSESRPKKLYFKSAHLLSNNLGEEFGLRMEKRGSGGRIYGAHIHIKDKTGGPGAYLEFIISREGQMHINRMHSFFCPGEPNWASYAKPQEELRGYGFLDVAIFLAASIAKKHGMTKAVIKPASMKLSRYYESCGFIRSSPKTGTRRGRWRSP